MSEPTEPTDDRPPAEELRELVGALRAYVEWQRELGAVGFPRAVRAAAPAQRVSAPQPAARQDSARSGVTPARTPVEPPPAQAPAPPPVRAVQPTATAVAAALPVPPTAAALAFLAEPTRVAPAAAVAAAAPAVALDPEERRRRLLVLAEEVKSCTRCRLHSSRTQTVFARGSGSSGVCFVGEGPGEQEDLRGEPFVGPAGQLLDRMIDSLGVRRDDVYVCNTVKCRPPENRNPSPDEMAACRPFLDQQLELVAPRAIVALGAVALNGLFGTSDGITRARGQWRLFRGKTPTMPTYHPAYLLREPSRRGEVWSDLQQLIQLLGLPGPRKG